jgi:hypothetical protein
MNVGKFEVLLQLLIIIINPCKPYLTASAPRLTHCCSCLCQVWVPEWLVYADDTTSCSLVVIASAVLLCTSNHFDRHKSELSAMQPEHALGDGPMLQGTAASQACNWHVPEKESCMQRLGSGCKATGLFVVICQFESQPVRHLCCTACCR